MSVPNRIPSRMHFVRHRIHDRKAVSLFELLIVMSISVVVLSAAMATLHRVFQADRRAREDFELQRAVERLSQQLRSDVHRAIDAQVTIDPTDAKRDSLRLTLTDRRGQSVEYAVRDHLVQRTEPITDTSYRYEEFELPSSCRIACATENAPRRVTMCVWLTARVLQRDVDTQSVSQQEIGRRLVGRIGAVVGRHGHLHRPQSDSAVTLAATIQGEPRNETP